MSDADAGRERTPGQHRGLRRVGGALLAIAIGAALIVGLLLVLNARDEAGVHQSVDDGPAPGVPFDAEASAPDLLTERQVRLLRLGDVLLLHAARAPPPALVSLRDELSGPPDPALEAAGQAVILARAPHAATAPAVTALAWGRRLEADDPADPQLAAFAEHWLGRGAGG